MPQIISWITTIEHTLLKPEKKNIYGFLKNIHQCIMMIDREENKSDL